MALAVEQLALGPVATNCYLVRRDAGSREAVVVDPAADAAEIRLRLAARGATCAAILLTHHHYDHFAALADLAEGTGAPVWLPRGDEEEFRRPTLLPPGVHLRPYTGDATLVAGGDTVEVAGIAFEVTDVPGHTAGHVAYHADGCLFSGDLVFAGGVGRVDLPGGDWDTLLASVRALADRYPPETVVHPGHGPSTTLGRELAANPFLAELRAAS